MVNNKDVNKITRWRVSTGSCLGFSRKVWMYAQAVMVIQMNTS